MPLNDLSLSQLVDLSDSLITLIHAGRALESRHVEPRFDLTPGVPASIMTDVMLPHVGSSAFRSMAEATFPTSSIEAASQPVDAQDDAAADLRQPEPLDAPPAVEGQAGGAPISADACSRSDDVASPPPEASPPPPGEPAIPQVDTSDEGNAESGGGSGDGSGSQPPAATHQTSFGQNAWTEEEDAELIRLTVFSMVKMGLSKTAAIRTAAKGIGRPEQGSAFRMHHKLKDRLEAALAETRSAKADAEAILSKSPEAARQDAPPPQAEVQGESAEPPVGDAPASVPEPGAGATLPPDLDAKSRQAAIDHGTHIASPIVAHIMTLPTKGGWTLERDLELMELSIEGWQPNEIALQLKIQASLIRPRFDLLTGLHEDANDKKVRRFKREDVLEALKSLTAGKAA